MTDENSTTTPEDIRRIQEIFMPISMKERRRYFGVCGSCASPDQSARFVHYTTADAAFKILSKGLIWMRNSTCMADYREVSHGLGVVQKVFRNSGGKDQFVSALDACLPGVAELALTAFDRSVPKFFTETYVTSVSEHCDTEDKNGRLSMWRAFGGASARVAIVLKVPWQADALQELRLFFSPVMYGEEPEVLNALNLVIEEIAKNMEFLKRGDSDQAFRRFVAEMVYIMLLSHATCLKHEGFKEEREWRAIYFPSIYTSTKMVKTIETVGGVPQVVYELPYTLNLGLAKLIDRVIIGPTPYPIAVFQAIAEALTQANVDPNEPNRIVFSEIPIRT